MLAADDDPTVGAPPNVLPVNPAAEHSHIAALMVEALPDAALAFDRQGRIVHLNGAARALLGAFGQSDVAVLSANARAGATKIRDDDGHLDALARLILSRLPEGETVMEDDAVDVTVATLDGRQVRVGVTGAPLRERDGRIVGTVAICRDVTDRRRREDAERERAQLLEAAFDVITDGILVYDRDAHLLYANAAAYATNPWLHRRDYQQQPFYERASHATPRDAEGRVLARAEWPVSRVLRGEVLTGADAVDTLVRRPNGQDVLLNVSGAPIRDTQGSIVGGVIVDRDVTERRRLERRTHQALDALLEMAQAMVLPPGDVARAGRCGPGRRAAPGRAGPRCLGMRTHQPQRNRATDGRAAPTVHRGPHAGAGAGLAGPC